MACVAGHDQPGAFPFAGHRAEDIGPFGALVGAPSGACHVWPIGSVSLLADAASSLPPQLYLDAFREPRPDLRLGGEVFLKPRRPARFAPHSGAFVGCPSAPYSIMEKMIAGTNGSPAG